MSIRLLISMLVFGLLLDVMLLVGMLLIVVS